MRSVRIFHVQRVFLLGVMLQRGQLQGYDQADDRIGWGGADRREYRLEIFLLDRNILLGQYCDQFFCQVLLEYVLLVERASFGLGRDMRWVNILEDLSVPYLYF